MAEQLTASDTNLANNFNSRVNEISGLNAANKSVIEAKIIEAQNHLNAINAQIIIANNYKAALLNLLSQQAARFTLNVQTRANLSTIESQIPQRLSQYPALADSAVQLQNTANQYVIGSTVMAASPVLAELVTLGKQNGKVISVDGNGNFAFVNSPSGTDRMATACFQIQFAQGVGGGSSATQVWVERGLNLTQKSEAGMVLDTATNRISLPAGTYIVWGYVACCQCGRFKSQFVNRTTGAAWKGTNVASTVGGDDFNGFSYFDASFTITSTNLFSIDSMVEFAHPTPAYTNGAPANISGVPENYGSVVVLKI